MSKSNIETLRPARFKAAEHAYKNFQAIIPAGVTAKDIAEHPNYFAHVGRHMQYGSEIRAVAEDGTWVAYFFVTYANSNDIRVCLLRQHKLESKVEVNDAREGYKVQLCGPLRWCIIRKTDGEHIKQNIPTEKEAHKELSEFISAMQR